jgi:YHS domain-containing protein
MSYLCTFATKENTMEKSIIHLEIGGEHYYFSSKKAIYNSFDSEKLGITYGSLRNFGLSAEKPYRNGKCVIRKGIVKSTEVFKNKESSTG